MGRSRKPQIDSGGVLFKEHTVTTFLSEYTCSYKQKRATRRTHLSCAAFKELLRTRIVSSRGAACSGPSARYASCNKVPVAYRMIYQQLRISAEPRDARQYQWANSNAGHELLSAATSTPISTTRADMRRHVTVNSLLPI